MKQYVIGLDIGTTCAKAFALAADGSLLGQGTAGYALISGGNQVEQRAKDWIACGAKAVREAVSGITGECRGISLSTQGGSTVALDSTGSFIGNALTWMDTRALAEADEIVKLLGGEYIYESSGWRINPSLDAAKLRWMRKQPVYGNAAKFYTTLEVMNRWLTGNPVIDPTNAAIRQLYHVGKDAWDEKLLEAATVSVEYLPQVLPTGELVGVLTAEAAAAMGLQAGVPVFNGAHDQYCASLGAGAVHAGDMLLSAGTTWVVMGITEKPLVSASYIAPGRHPVPGLYGAIASLICSGASLQWFKNNFLQEDFDIINEEVSQRQARTGDLMYFPYLAGAGYPIWDSEARGAFTGLTLEHDRFDLARAVMEGVAFGVRRAVADFSANGAAVQKITVMGGAAKSPVWCQMIADITGIPIQRLSQAEVCAIGAGAIALHRAGFYDSYEAAARACVQPQTIYMPEPGQVASYEEKFKKYDKMWNCLAQYTR